MARKDVKNLPRKSNTKKPITYYDAIAGKEITMQRTTNYYDAISGRNVTVGNNGVQRMERTTDPVYRQQGVDESNAAYNRAIEAASERSASQAEMLRRQRERTQGIRNNPNAYLQQLMDQYDQTMTMLEKGNYDNDYALERSKHLKRTARDLSAQMTMAGMNNDDVRGYLRAVEEASGMNALDPMAGQMQFLNTLTSEEEKLEYLSQHDPARAEAMLNNMAASASNWADIYKNQLETMPKNDANRGTVERNLANAEAEAAALGNRDFYADVYENPGFALQKAVQSGNAENTEYAWQYLMATDPTKAMQHAQYNVEALEAKRFELGQQDIDRFDHAAIDKRDQELADLSDQILMWNERLHKATYQMEGVRMGDVAVEGSATYDPNFATASQYIPGVQSNEESYKIHAYINADEAGRSALVRRYGQWNPTTESMATPEYFDKLEYLNDSEKQLFNYYYNRDPEEAMHYLDVMQESLASREAADIFKEYEGNTLKEIFAGVRAGASQFMSGISGTVTGFFGGDEYIPYTTEQQLSGMIREDLTDHVLAKGAFDLAATTTNMLPSVLAGAAFGPAAGKVVMGASVAGNAYQEAVNKGFAPIQARLYSAAITGAELYLQDLLGGVSALSGAKNITTKAFNSLLSKVDNAVARAAIQLGVSNLGEGVEEYLQEIIGPVIENAILGTHNKIELVTEEAIYSGILGFLSAAPMNIALPGSEFKQNLKTARMENLIGESNRSRVDEVVSTARKTNADSDALARVQKQLEKGGADNVSKRDLALLVQETQEAKANAKASTQTDGVGIRSDAAPEQTAEYAGTSQSGAKPFRGTNAVRVASVDETGIAVQTSDGKTVSLNSVKQEGTALEVLRYVTEDSGMDAATVNDMVRFYEWYLNNGKSSAGKASRFYNLYQTAVDLGRTGADIREVKELTDDRSMKNALEAAYARGQTIAKGEQAAAEMGVNGAAALRSFSYAQLPAFQQYYAAGRDGMSLAEAQRKYKVNKKYMAEMKAAFNAGKTDASVQTGVSKNTNTKKPGRMTWAADTARDTISGRQKKSVDFIETLAAVTGIEFVIYESKADASGKLQGAQGMYKDGKIYIDLNAGMLTAGDLGKSAMLRTVSHELTHYMKDAAPAEYAKLREFMLQHLNEWQGKTLDQLIQEKQNRSSEKLSREEALDEVIADGCEMLLRDSAAVETLAKENRTLFDRIREWITEFLNNLKSAFEGVDAEHSEAAYLMEQYAGELQALWDNALKVAVNNRIEILTKVSDSEASAIATMHSEREVLKWNIDWDPDNNSSIKNQMSKHLDEINQMKPVGNVEFKKVSGNTYANVLNNILKTKFGYKIERQDGATFLFDETAITTLRRYVTRDEEAAAIIATPYVLKRGKAISGHRNHKNLGNPSITYAGPVTINGETVNVAVAVLFGKKNRPHSMRVLMPSGAEYVMGQEKAEPGREGAAHKDAVDSPTGSAFSEIVTQNIGESQGTFKKNNSGKKSEREPASSGEYRYLKAAGKIKNEQAAQVEKVQEYLQTSKMETRRLMGSGTVRKITKSVAVETAREMRSRYGQDSISQEDLQEGIARIARLTAETESAVEAYRQAEYEALAIASRMVDNAAGKTIEAKQDYNGIRKMFRGQRLVMEAVDRKLLEASGGYDLMREHLRGRVLLSASGTPIDQFYDEVLAKNYPHYFPPEITTPADQLLRIADVLDRFRGIFRNPASGVTKDITEIIAQDLLQLLYNDTAPNRTAEADARLHEEMVKAYYENKINEVKAAWQDDIERMKLDLEKKRLDQRTAKKEKEDRDKLLHIARRLSRIRVGSMWYDQARELLGNIDTVAKSMLGVTVIGDYIGNVSSESVPDVGTNDRGRKIVNVEALEAWVRERQESDPDFNPDGKTMEKLARLKGKKIAEMEIGQVRDLLNAMLHFEHEMRNSKKLINAQDKRELSAQAADIRSHLEEGGKKINLGLKKVMEKWKLSTLDPIHFFRMLTAHYETDPMMRAAEDLLKGEGQMHDYIRKAEASMQGFQDDPAFMRSITGKSARTIEITGRTADGMKTVRITPDMAIAILLHSKNWENIRHIEGGGLRIPNYDLLMRGAVDEAYNQGAEVMRFRKSDLEAIAAKLTDKERSYAAKLQRYYNETSKNAMNATSRDLLGYDRYTVPNYYPIEVNKNKIGKQLETVVKDNSVEKPGFGKERTGSASEIMLRGATDTFGRMVKAHAKYYGMAIPVRNFSKLYGQTIWEINDSGGEGEHKAGYDIHSVAQTMRDNWGTEAADYIEKLLGQIQNPTRPGEDIDRLANKIRGNYARAVLTANLSVTAKQVSAYPTAAIVTGWKALNKALVSKRTGDPALIAKYSPWLWHRSQGSMSKELGDLAKGKSKSAFVEKLENATDWVGWMDTAVVKKLWVAAEYCVKERRPDLQAGTDRFYQETAKIFDEIIMETQPDNSLMLRPQALRSESTFIRMLNTFKGQAYLTFNTAFDSVNNLQAKERQLKAAEAALKNDNNEEARAVAEKARQDVTDAKHQAARTFSALLVSQATSSAIAILYALLRGKTKDFEDEEGKLKVGKMLAGFGKDLVSNMAGIVPFGTEIYDAIMAFFFKETYYGLDLIALESLQTVAEQLIKAPEIAGSVWSMLKGEAPVADTVQHLLDLSSSVCKLFGIPQDNMETLVKIPVLWIMRAAMPKNEAEYWYRYWTEKATAKNRKKNDYNNLFWTALDGDMDAYKKMRGKLWKMIWQTNRDFKDGEITKDEAKAKATENINSNMRGRIMELVLAGELEDAEAVQLLQEIAGMEQADAEDDVLIWKYKALSGSEEVRGAGQAMDYYLLAKPAKISIEVYEEFLSFKSNRKKAEVIEYIDKLKLTDAQKDALYLCEYAESGLKKTPWH